jgi:Methyltransferase domain
MLDNTHSPDHSSPHRQISAATPLRRHDDNDAAASLLADVLALSAQVPGEQSVEDLIALTVLVHATAPLGGHVVDVGAGQGRVAAALGQAARATGCGRVFAVDLFPEADEAPDDASWSMESLLERMTACDLLQYVLPHHGTGATFAQLMPEDFRCRLLLLESAGACSDVATDIFVLERTLAPGGWLAIDSAFSSFPGAALAIETLFRQRNHFELARQVTPSLFIARKRTQ